MYRNFVPSLGSFFLSKEVKNEFHSWKNDDDNSQPIFPRTSPLQFSLLTLCKIGFSRTIEKAEKRTGELKEREREMLVSEEHRRTQNLIKQIWTKAQDVVLPRGKCIIRNLWRFLFHSPLALTVRKLATMIKRSENESGYLCSNKRLDSIKRDQLHKTFISSPLDCSN